MDLTGWATCIASIAMCLSDLVSACFEWTLHCVYLGGLTSWAGAFLGPFLYISIIFYMCVCRVRVFVCCDVY